MKQVSIIFFDAFENIKLLLEHDYKGSVEEPENPFKYSCPTYLIHWISKTNLLVHLKNLMKHTFQSLVDIEQEILAILENKGDAPKELHEKIGSH